MTEPITHDEVIDVALALSTATAQIVAGLQAIADDQVREGWGSWDTDHLRAAGELLAHGFSAASDVVRRAADQVDPPKPAAPDLTTPEGWNEMARRWLADGRPSDWRGHTDRIEVANLRMAIIRSFDGSNIYDVLSEMLLDCVYEMTVE